MKRVLAGVPALLLLATLSACGDDEPADSVAKDDTASTPASDTTEAETTDGDSEPGATEGDCVYTPDGSESGVDLPPASPDVDATTTVRFKTTIGAFTATLDGKRAPCTVNSFVSLVEQGYFDGTPCHRMTTSELFKVLQCGDPTGTGTGGPGYTIPDEYDGSETYGAGTLAMARTTAPNSGGSQFFIVYGDTSLNPEYTVFGTVDQDGIDAITQAAKAGVTPQMGEEDGAPKTKIDLEAVTLE